MRQDNASAGWPFCATDVWTRETASFDSAFNAEGINSVEDEFYNTRFSGVTQGDIRLYVWFMWTYYKLLRQRDVLGLFDRIESTLPANPDNRVLVDGKLVPVGVPMAIGGRKISVDLLFSIDDFYNIYELMPDIATKDGIVVADLGAGWGRLGHVLLQVNPGITYLVFDIPEPLLVASTYLPGVLADFSVSSYRESRVLDKIDRETLGKKSIWFFGAQRIEDFPVGSIDVIANIASFQEMTIDQVNCYLDIFRNVAKGGHIYLRNEITGISSNFDDSQLSQGCEQVYRRLCRFSPHFMEAGYRVI